MISTSEIPTISTNRVPIRSADDLRLEEISRTGTLSLTLEEMRTVRAHFNSLGRDPSDVELETIAQTWSEHCYHKTFRAEFHYRDANTSRTYQNLLKETIFTATQEINSPACLSVFKDNAGVIEFDGEDAVCFKVETHNHPSALEPYGGAGTGIGGVIRDVLGCGLGAKPVMNTDVFCFGMLDTPQNSLPEGVLHPRRVARGVIAGVRDYGNRMGIPTANGAVYFDANYTNNPLVFCGTVGLMPVNAIEKTVHPGDLVVCVGGRTGRDGIHGATFSSVGLEKGIASSVVQIGHAIQEKKVLDVLLQAQKKRLYRSITDCGAGGFSSAVGELGKDTGVRLYLEKAPLKYPGLAPWEIWLSESQERMVLAVPPKNWTGLKTLFAQEDVEAVVIGEFTDDKKLNVRYQNETVAELDMNFLHDGIPKLTLEAVWDPEEHKKRHTPVIASPPQADEAISLMRSPRSANDASLAMTIHALLAHPNIASKESVIRQYDHEVQGGSVIKPLMGPDGDAPSDAAVIRPKLDSWRGVAVSNGFNPEMGKTDPYLMAQMAVDEAYRNLVSVGGNLKHAAILDNFCWGSSKDKFELGALVRSAEGAKDAALAYSLPFISGKDSFNNTWRTPDGVVHSIPPTLLISAIGVLDDVRQCVTSGLKAADNLLYVVGETRIDMSIKLAEAKTIYKKLQTAMRNRLIRACHDVSEGGVAAAVAEMCFGSLLGAQIDLPQKGLEPAVYLFNETPSRLVVEVAPENKEYFEQTLGLLFIEKLGQVVKKPDLTISNNGVVVMEEAVKNLKYSWQESLKNL